MQTPPTLCKLDRMIINEQWDRIFPNSTLLSLPRLTSDHIPIQLQLSSDIPKPSTFRYENNWKFQQQFKVIVQGTWDSVQPTINAAATIVQKLKALRKEIKIWKKNLKPEKVQLQCAKKTLDLMDWMVEQRTLSELEVTFRNLVKDRINTLVHSIATAARQRGKITWCVLGDEDTDFYHARASARMRKNQIRVIEEQGSRFYTHRERKNSY